MIFDTEDPKSIQMLMSFPDFRLRKLSRRAVNYKTLSVSQEHENEIVRDSETVLIWKKLMEKLETDVDTYSKYWAEREILLFGAQAFTPKTFSGAMLQELHTGHLVMSTMARS